jgi:epoxyqueuosine reductase QueG
MDTYSKIAGLVKSASCDFVGVADLAIARDEIRDQGGSGIADFPRAISIGIILPHAIVDQLPNRADRAVAVNYLSHAYNVINQRLDAVASQVASMLQQDGYKAQPIPAAERSDSERICAVFSHKLAAHLAGLGWIGKNCLLVTPQAGPRVRLTSVLTDAPLTATGNRVDERCGDCTECVDICPAHAFTGRPFRAEEPRSARYDAAKCEKYFEDAKTVIGLPVCALCLYVCPYGRQR